MSTLALLGGEPIFKTPLAKYPSIGKPELKAVNRVMRSGSISGFYGSWCEEFWGGPEVLAFEEAWRERFRVNKAVSVNSATSGLIVAMGAIGLAPGDEVIVPPYTMSATAVAPLIYGGIPVFVDIEPETFCLNPDLVRQAITPRTKAILTVNLFGHPSRLSELRAIADEKGVYLVEDSAQSPLAEEKGKYAGAVGHIGIFSLNFHKHIHTGEGGVCITDDAELALRMKLIRNHGENVVEELGMENLTNLFGFNMRLTELQAAIGIEQLKKIDEHVGRRESLARELTNGTRDLDGITPPVVRKDCRHVYYTWSIRYNENETDISRELFCRALNAEGFPCAYGYVKPLYLLPLFQKKIAAGSHGFPFTMAAKESANVYQQGICPVCERMHAKELILFEPCAYDVDREKQERLIAALRKVCRNLESLRKFEPKDKSI